MPPAALPSSVSRPPARWRRPLLWGVLALLVLELVYIALLATGGLARLLNHLIPDTQMSWSKASSVVPGRVHLENFVLLHEEKSGGHWRLDIDRAEVNVSLNALFRRQFKTESLDVWGLRARIHSVTPEQTGEARARTQDAEEKKKEKPGGWKILLHEVRVHGVHELIWNEARLTGIEEVAGALDVESGERIFLHETRLRLGPGELFVQGDAVANVEKGTASATLEARYQGEEGIDLIAGLTGGRLQLSATVPAISSLQHLLPRLEGVSPEGGAGRVEVDLHVKDGRLAPGTVLQGSGEPFEMPVGPLRLKAPWRFHADVHTREDGEDRLGLKFTMGPVRMEGGKGRDQALQTPEVVVLMGARSPRLGEALPDVHVALRAARSNPLELRMLNGWLGPSFQVESGRAYLEVSSRANPENGGGEGHLSLSTQGLQAHWGGARITGRVLMDVDAHKLAFNQDKVTLHGSRLLLRGVSVRTGRDNARDWDGTLVFPEATLRMSPPSFRGRFTGSFSNAAPFIALLTQQGAFPHFLSPLLQAEGLEISGVVALGEGGAKLSTLRARGEGLELRGQAESAGGATRAVLLVKLGIVSVGVEVAPGNTSIRLVLPERWYTQKTGEPVP
ncbi:hypothetical protein [Melittangium boletus]|uniref:AsmA-like C-terminal domain-containing protein n=1 Tax=Melittangium boletus DSM 14713 TaxID=1294270 RepID=A0A250IP73_9BACT|nr:hypothetical protein [Melittangium boletus]ATB33534.1 hypothetical protein MEBOL_007032 [Melittangium boletus DSM 14713]